jgi:hypothetical protein
MRSAQILAGSWLASESAGPTQGITDTGTREDVMSVARIALGFRALAGSDENAVALVASLREGVTASLAYPTAGTDPEPNVIDFDAPTAPMDWHDVRMALILARDALTAFGVLRPTGEQLHAVLLGGEAVVPGERVVEFRGVLRMRADGDSWGRIASQRFQRRAVTRIE